jgi:hypothetical protein
MALLKQWLWVRVVEAISEQSLAAIRANADLVIGELGAQSGVTPFGLNEDSVRYVEGFIERQRAQGGDWSGLVNVFGSYFGEAIIAAAGGAWTMSEHGIGVRFANGDWCFPFAKVAKQFENGVDGGDSVLGFYRVAVEQIAR